jgi:hypothetical protein
VAQCDQQEVKVMQRLQSLSAGRWVAASVARFGHGMVASKLHQACCSADQPGQFDSVHLVLSSMLNMMITVTTYTHVVMQYAQAELTCAATLGMSALPNAL